MWILVDCNNFFVSCERVFRPDLWARPVLVLSSNDGCVVSRSQEVKDLGIAMGVPKFQIEEIIKKNQVACFSSNFRLYADLSARVMRVIAAQVETDRQEVYSIDECFVQADDGWQRDWVRWGEYLREIIGKQTGIPVTVGIAATKTLAKLAVEIAKADVLGTGVMFFQPEQEGWREQYLAQMSVTQVWGLGTASARKLLAQKIQTVSELTVKPQRWVRQNFGLLGERVWRELQGESCIELSESKPSQRQIGRSRTFGEGVTEKEELRLALSEHLTVAGESLRRQGLRARVVSVMIRTGYFVEPVAKYNGWASVGLSESSSYLPDLMVAMNRALEQAWRPGYVYKKAGVVLMELEPETAWQPSLEWTASLAEDKKQALMRSVETINRRYGARKVRVMTVTGRARKKWRPKADLRSREYTTRWEELREVR